MGKDIVVPIDFADWKLTNPTPYQQVEYFNKHSGIQMPIEMWNQFYVSTLEHKGFHCSSCLSDEEYLGYANFDDKCCCLSEEVLNG